MSILQYKNDIFELIQMKINAYFDLILLLFSFKSYTCTSFLHTFSIKMSWASNWFSRVSIILHQEALFLFPLK